MRNYKSDFFDYVKFMEEIREPFRIEYTNGMYQIFSALHGKREFKNGTISMKGMNFIKTIKNRIIKSEIIEKIPKKTPKELGLKYLLFNDHYMGKTMDNIIELDLNSAYWKSAYKLGIISKKDYYKGLQQPKLERLASLGSLAKTVRVREFNGRKYSKVTIKNDSQDTRHVWFAISSEVDKLMLKCAKELKDQFVFYWVDALFFIDTPENRKKVQSMVKEAGYDSKFIKILFAKFDPDSAKVWSKEKGKLDPEHNAKKRFFCYDINNKEQFQK